VIVERKREINVNCKNVGINRKEEKKIRKKVKKRLTKDLRVKCILSLNSLKPVGGRKFSNAEYLLLNQKTPRKLGEPK
jgi:hypothetical protein